MPLMFWFFSLIIDSPICFCFIINDITETDFNDMSFACFIWIIWFYYSSCLVQCGLLLNGEVQNLFTVTSCLSWCFIKVNIELISPLTLMYVFHFNSQISDDWFNKLCQRTKIHSRGLRKATKNRHFCFLLIKMQKAQSHPGL